MKPREWWVKFYRDGNIGQVCTAPGYPAKHPDLFEERRLIEWPLGVPLPELPEPTERVRFASNLSYAVDPNLEPGVIEFRQRGKVIGRFKVDP